MVANISNELSRQIGSRWKIFVIIALVILFSIFVYILLPLADGIMLGLVFAYIARPIYMPLKRKRHLGAFIATMFIVAPITLILGMGIVEIANQIVWISENQTVVLGSLFDFIRDLNIPHAYYEQIQQTIWDSSLSVLPLLGNLVFVSYARGIAMFMINLMIAIFMCFFLLADGDALYRSMLRIVPDGDQNVVKRYVHHMDVILSGVFIGNAYAALSVSTLSVIVFYAFGLSHVLALATLIFVASAIPMFAGYMVLVVLSIIRYFSLGLESALIFFVICSIVIYVPPELFLRPYLAGIKSHIHPFLIMLTFLGGAFVGGIAGFFAAPILLGSLVAAYRVYVECQDKAEAEQVDAGNAEVEQAE
ncbi:AI-2E family transporter [Methanococcoides methylutens]|uniref:AI-2E family transporter n=1 Tax=Methanococcoides methylutens TaxID=2226 RepID=UPI00064E612D|nr:AI-2E family transporter [Methanococcoides methylutens]